MAALSRFNRVLSMSDADDDAAVSHCSWSASAGWSSLSMLMTSSSWASSTSHTDVVMPLSWRPRRTSTVSPTRAGLASSAHHDDESTVDVADEEKVESSGGKRLLFCQRHQLSACNCLEVPVKRSLEHLSRNIHFRNSSLPVELEHTSVPNVDICNQLTNSDEMDSKKRGGLRGPVAKRSPDAVVTMRGWLDKQGSEGLRLWKTRWFVLSEYCLYYYKDNKEDKLLGSITLPSYRVSPVATEDRVHRRFAFRIEHSNMRTYYFACDNKTRMTEWMNAISLASIMQRHDVRQTDVRSAIAAACEERLCSADSGMGTAPASLTLSNGGMSLITSSGCDTADVPQPLYANAPPKPRRLSCEAPAAVAVSTPMTAVVAHAPAHRRTPDVYSPAARGHWPVARCMVGDYDDLYSGPAGGTAVASASVVSSHERDSLASSSTGGRIQATPAAVYQNVPAPKCMLPTATVRPQSAAAEMLLSAPSFSLGAGADTGGRMAFSGMEQPPLVEWRRPKSSMATTEPAGCDDEQWSEQQYADRMRQASYSRLVDASAGGQAVPHRHCLDVRPQQSAINGRPMAAAAQAFSRSASARYGRRRSRDQPPLTDAAVAATAAETINNVGSATGEQLREESMRRLLEWKQRMLLSPLTRRSSKLEASRLVLPPNQYRRRVREEQERSQVCRQPRPQTALGVQHPDETDGRKDMLMQPQEDYANAMRMQVSRRTESRSSNSSTAAVSSPRGPRSVRSPSERIRRQRHNQRRNNATESLADRSFDVIHDECSTEPKQGHPALVRSKTESDFRGLSKRDSFKDHSDGFDGCFESQKTKYNSELHNYNSFYPQKEKVCEDERIKGGCLQNHATAIVDLEPSTSIYQTEDCSLNRQSDSGYDTARNGVVTESSDNTRHSADSENSAQNDRLNVDCVTETLGQVSSSLAGSHVDDALDESAIVKKYSYEYLRPDNQELVGTKKKVAPPVMSKPRKTSYSSFDRISSHKISTDDRIPAHGNARVVADVLEKPLIPVKRPSIVCHAQVTPVKPSSSISTNVTAGSVNSGITGKTALNSRDLPVVEAHILSGNGNVPNNDDFSSHMPGSISCSSAIAARGSTATITSTVINNVGFSSDIRPGASLTGQTNTRSVAGNAPICSQGETLPFPELHEVTDLVSTTPLGDILPGASKVSENLPVTSKPIAGRAISEPVYVNHTSVAPNISPENQYLPMGFCRKLVCKMDSSGQSPSRLTQLRPAPSTPLPPIPSSEDGLIKPANLDDSTYMVMCPKGLDLSFEASNGMFSKLSKHGDSTDIHDYTEIPDSVNGPTSCGSSTSAMLTQDTVSAVTKNESVLDRKEAKSVKSKDESKMSKMEKKRSYIKRRTCDSSASDADDEGSKDPEVCPSNRRLSMSDTFRPASYYLQSHDLRVNHDSSDSDLVSPPSIPTSPVPADETEINNTCDDSRQSYMMNMLLSSQGLELSSCGKITSTIRISRSDSHSESPKISGRSSRLSSAQSCSGRAVSGVQSVGEHCPDSVDSIGNAPELSIEDGVRMLTPEDRYPGLVDQHASHKGSLSEEPFLQSNDQQSDSVLSALTSKTMLRAQTYENVPAPRRRKSSEMSIYTLSVAATDAADIKRASCSSLASIELAPAKNPEFLSDFARSVQDTASHDHSQLMSVIDRPTSVVDNSSVVTSDIGSQRPRMPRTQLTRVSTSSNDAEMQNNANQSPSVSVIHHLRGGSNLSVGSVNSTGSDGRAPYYYSDLVGICSVQEKPARSRPQLNNQRELETSKRQDIGRKVNQIGSSEEKFAQAGRIAAQLRNSVEYLASQKVSDLDERNVFVSDTMQRMRRQHGDAATAGGCQSAVVDACPAGINAQLRSDSDDSGSAQHISHHRAQSLPGMVEGTSLIQREHGGASLSSNASGRRQNGENILSRRSQTPNCFGNGRGSQTHCTDVRRTRTPDAMPPANSEVLSYRPDDRPPMPLPRSEAQKSRSGMVRAPPYRAPPSPSISACGRNIRLIHHQSVQLQEGNLHHTDDRYCSHPPEESFIHRSSTSNSRSMDSLDEIFADGSGAPRTAARSLLDVSRQFRGLPQLDNHGSFAGTCTPTGHTQYLCNSQSEQERDTRLAFTGGVSQPSCANGPPFSQSAGLDESGDVATSVMPGLGIGSGSSMSAPLRPESVPPVLLPSVNDNLTYRPSPLVSNASSSLTVNHQQFVFKRRCDREPSLVSEVTHSPSNVGLGKMQTLL